MGEEEKPHSERLCHYEKKYALYQFLFFRDSVGSDMEDVALVLAQETWIYLITIN